MRVRTLCGLNALKVKGETLILATPPKLPIFHPVFDFFYSCVHRCRRNNQSSPAKILFFGVRAISRESIINQVKKIIILNIDVNPIQNDYKWVSPSEYSPNSNRGKVEMLFRFTEDNMQRN